MFSFKEVVFILWFCYFSLLYTFVVFWFFGRTYKNVYLSVVDWIFWLNFFVESFEVCYSFVGFVYVYCLVHHSVVVFCFVFRGKSAAHFFVFATVSNAQVWFVLRHVQLFAFFTFNNVHICCGLRMFSFLFFQFW